MTATDARAFATEWVASWNAHDLERVLSHYRQDAVLSSPIAAKKYGSDTVAGRDALRNYFAPALAADSVLHFTIVQIYEGFSTITIVYDATLPSHLGDRRGAETFMLDDEGKIVRSMACYAI
jgi:cystathionine beta-lyase family protein involved in aluminum resistance